MTRLFSFAVISDTHLNEDDFASNSPFEVNRLSNRRMRYVVEDLNTRDIAHVIHLGDIVHPVPSNHELYKRAAERFFEQMKGLEHPVYFIPGNHDVGDKPMSWSPAGGIRESFLESWSEQFGDHYFSFLKHGIGFVGINAQLYGSGLRMERAQREWLVKTMDSLANHRIFLFSHYPPFLLDPKEDEHYDNLGLKGRKEFLGIIDSHPVEALFTGHVHHFWYNRYRNCHCYLLPSTAFTRQDYSEMFRIGPNYGFGRDDQAKLGYLLVHVYRNGHEFELVRCGGMEIGAGSKRRFNTRRIDSVSPGRNRFPVMGFDLRHDWLERVQIPPTGGLDEFDRKTVRNDYAMLALWEMGSRRLRIPLSDLMDQARRKRLDDLVRLGFQFTLFSCLPSDPGITKLVLENSRLLESWEISGQASEALHWGKTFKSMADDAKGLKLFFSPLKRKADTVRQGQTYYHVINHGFTVHDFKAGVYPSIDDFKSVFDGIVLRCGIQDSIAQVLELADRIQRESRLQVSVHLRMSADSPAEFQDNEVVLCNRLAESVMYAWGLGIDRIFSDTLTDNDRGYFPRIGLSDREYNPRSGARLIRNLHAVITNLGSAGKLGAKGDEDRMMQVSIQAGAGTFTVFLFAPGNTKPDVHVGELVSTGGYWVDWQNNCMTRDIPKQTGLPILHINQLHQQFAL